MLLLCNESLSPLFGHLIKLAPSPLLCPLMNPPPPHLPSPLPALRSTFKGCLPPPLSSPFLLLWYAIVYEKKSLTEVVNSYQQTESLPSNHCKCIYIYFVLFIWLLNSNVQNRVNMWKYEMWSYLHLMLTMVHITQLTCKSSRKYI